MPSTRYISKPSTRHVGAGVLVFLLALITALMLVLPAAKAYATDSGSTSLGIMIIDSEKGQSVSPGTTNLGIRVTNSKETFVTEYTLTLNFNGGSGNTSTVAAIYNQLLSDITDLPSRTGYTFLGYYDSPEGGKQIYDKDGTSSLVWTTTKDTELFAHWEAKTYTVNFDFAEGDGGITSTKVTFGAPMPDITIPTRDGYTFAGYFDSENNQYYEAAGSEVGERATWDKDADNVTLTAHWTLILDFTFPSNALVQIDAVGNVTGQEDFTFSSGTVKPLKITAVKGAPTTTAASLFAQGTIPDGLRILLTPKVGSSDEVKVPLNSAKTSISNGGWILAAGSTTNPTTFAVAFSLFLPSGIQLNYFPEGDVAIANLSYVVEAVDAS